MSQANEFIKKLEDAAFRNQIAPALAKVAEGDWDTVVQIASQAGFKFTREELKAAVPPGFFKDAGKNPGFGWDKSTLEK